MELSMELMTDEMAPVGATEEMTELMSPPMEDRKDWTWAWATEAPTAATKMVEKRMMIVFVWRAEALNVSKGALRELWGETMTYSVVVVVVVVVVVQLD
jgi:hypothetical protein